MRLLDEFDFGTALDCLKSGEAVFRRSWRKKTIIYCENHDKLTGFLVAFKDEDEIHFPVVENSPTIKIVDLETDKESLWLANNEDIFAEDWMVYRE